MLLCPLFGEGPLSEVLLYSVCAIVESLDLVPYFQAVDGPVAVTGEDIGLVKDVTQ